VSALKGDCPAKNKRKDDELAGGVRFWEDFLSDRCEFVLGRQIRVEQDTELVSVMEQFA
jgi:hypothetical protein